MIPGCSSERHRVFRTLTWLAGLLCAQLSAASALAERGDGEDEGVSFVGEATLGVNFYDISSPFDTSAVSGFFDQWRYIPGKEGEPPYYVDLFHLDMGFQRLDETYMTRFEFWSPNQLNERGIFELDWRGLGLEVNHRRRRGDLLRFFPSGTGEGLGIGDIPGYGSQYVPDTPNLEIFAANRRFWIRRQGMDGTLALDFDAMGWGNPVLEKLSLYGDYQVRDGYRQDSLLGPDQVLGDFQGDRRKIDQEVATVGVAVLAFPVEALTAKLDVKLQSFSERAAQEVAFAPGVPSLPNFVPDTNRITARLDVSKRWTSASFALGAFATHLEQTGTESPLQQAEMLDRNVVTSYSVWSSFDSNLPSIFDVTGFAKWTYRENGIDPAFEENLQVSSPYVRSTGRLKANLELGARPVAGTRTALGYRAEYTHRSLRFAGLFAVAPGASAIRPDSLHHFFYLKGRTRPLRGLRLQGELGYDWGPETAYPNEFEEAIYFSGRGSYTLPVALPVVLSASGRVIDGKSPRYEFSGPFPQFFASAEKTYRRLAWNYDVTATIVPIAALSLFATFAQQRDDQEFRHIRPEDQRRFAGTSYYVDSDPNYRANTESLSFGGAFALNEQIDLSAAASLTWTHADFRGDSVTGRALNAANEIDSRIIALETDVDYEIVEGLAFGVGYRWQNYLDSKSPELLVDRGRLDYSGTVHTVTLRATVDFRALPSLLP